MFDKKKDCKEKVNNLFVVMAKVKVNNFTEYITKNRNNTNSRFPKFQKSNMSHT